MPSKALVVDANILVRAVLGKRAREVIETYAESVSFFIPDAAYVEAEEHVTALVIQRRGDPKKAAALLHALGSLMERIGSDVYSEFEAVARERLGQRDPEDWPILAAALALNCPIWDRGRRFLRMWRRHLDLAARRSLSAGVRGAQGAESAGDCRPVPHFHLR